jgi:ABC-2 type transport system ATP-binding protein
MPAHAVEERVEAALAALNLTDLADRRAAVLSRGQTQRLGLAKAFLPDPPILLLDEPTSGIDPINAAALLERLRALAAAGRTVIASSHTLSEAVELADDVTVLHRGRVVGGGPPDQLRERLVGTAYRVRLRGSEGLEPALAALGREARPTADGRGYVVEVGSEQETEKLVAELVRTGVGVRECVAADNPLEDVYRQLLGKDGTDDASDPQA